MATNSTQSPASTTSTSTSSTTAAATATAPLLMDLATVSQIVGIAAECKNHKAAWVTVNGKKCVVIYRVIGTTAINQEVRAKREVEMVKDAIKEMNFAVVEDVATSTSTNSDGEKVYSWLMLVGFGKKDIAPDFMPMLLGGFEAAVVKCVRSSKRESKKEGKEVKSDKK